MSRSAADGIVSNPVNSAPVYATFPVQAMYSSDKVSIPRRAAAVVLLRLAAGSAALGDALLRPGEMHLEAPGEDGVEVLVRRVVAVGSELRACACATL